MCIENNFVQFSQYLRDTVFTARKQIQRLENILFNKLNRTAKSYICPGSFDKYLSDKIYQIFMIVDLSKMHVSFERRYIYSLEICKEQPTSGT